MGAKVLMKFFMKLGICSFLSFSFFIQICKILYGGINIYIYVYGGGGEGSSIGVLWVL